MARVDRAPCTSRQSIPSRTVDCCPLPHISVAVFGDGWNVLVALVRNDFSRTLP